MKVGKTESGNIKLQEDYVNERMSFGKTEIWIACYWHARLWVDSVRGSLNYKKTQ